MASARALAVRWLLYAAGPWLVLMVGLMVWWASLYFLAPVFLPFSAYSFSEGQWTIFAGRHLGLGIHIAYTVLVALIATWLGRRLSFGKAAAVFAALVVVGSLSVHGAMAALGYEYWYDGP